MLIYYILYVIILILPLFRINSALSRDGEYFRYRRTTCEIMSLLVIILLAFRHPSMGVDLRYGRENGYLDAFENIANLSLGDVLGLQSYLNYERGYILFNKLISYVSSNYQCLLIFAAIASIIPISRLIKRNSFDYRFSFVVYLGLPVFLLCYSGLRQSIAVAVCYFAYPFLKERKLFKFCIVVGIAALFHWSAIFFLVAYPAYHMMRISNNAYFCLSMAILLIVFIFRTPIFTVMSGFVKDNVNIYSNGSITLMMVFTAIYAFNYFFMNPEDDEDQGNNNIFYIACLCQCFGEINNLAMRVGYYFMPVLAVLLPNIVFKNRDNKLFSLLYYAIQLIFVVYGLHAISASTWAMANPYSFFWQ